MERSEYRKLSESERIDSLIADLSKPVDGHRIMDVDEIDAPLLVKALTLLKKKAKVPLKGKRPKVFEHCGCRVERVRGDKLGRRGRIRLKYGYIATHLATGKERTWNPNEFGSVTLENIKLYVEAWAQLCERGIG